MLGRHSVLCGGEGGMGGEEGTGEEEGMGGEVGTGEREGDGGSWKESRNNNGRMEREERKESGEGRES